jgi:predicted metal-dependent phosphoesterase TrpH
MPARQPFTALCQAAAGPQTGRADLHLHTTYSDGSYTPTQVVELARRSGLAAVAITDHDTLGGIDEATRAAGSRLEIIPGVEISTVYRDRELHLLGYFVRPEDAALRDALEQLRVHRRGRFWDMVERLRDCGVCLEDEELGVQPSNGSLGRRHLAEMLVKARRAGSVREAFHRYLHDGGRVALPKVRLPVAEALDRVRAAGGVASWAHPSYDCQEETLAELRDRGLGAVEAVFPSARPSRQRELRSWAAALGLAVTGGSDCHGPEPVRRAIGSCSITTAELEAVRVGRLS